MGICGIFKDRNKYEHDLLDILISEDRVVLRNDFLRTSPIDYEYLLQMVEWHISKKEAKFRFQFLLPPTG